MGHWRVAGADGGELATHCDPHLESPARLEGGCEQDLDLLLAVSFGPRRIRFQGHVEREEIAGLAPERRPQLIALHRLRIVVALAARDAEDEVDESDIGLRRAGG